MRSSPRGSGLRWRSLINRCASEAWCLDKGAPARDGFTAAVLGFYQACNRDQPLIPGRAHLAAVAKIVERIEPEPIHHINKNFDVLTG